MKNKLVRIAALVILTAVFVSSFNISGQADESSDAKAAYEAKLKAAQELKEQYENSKKEAEELKKEYSQQRSDIESYIEELDLKLNDLSLAIFELDGKIAENETELEATRRALEAAKLKVGQQYATMKARIKYIYENGETTWFDAILNAENVNDIMNQIEYLSGIQAYDKSLLERYEAAQAEVEAHEKYLEASLEELEAMRVKQTQDKATIEELMALKNEEIQYVSEQLGVADEYIFTYMREISNAEVEIDLIIKAEEERVAEEERKRKEEEERLRREEEERRRAAEEAARKAAEAAASGTKKSALKNSLWEYDQAEYNNIVLSEETDSYKMIWPLPGDHRTYSKFGKRVAPIKGASTYHQGWDIGGEFGSPIVAVLAGKVIAVSYNSSAGNYVKVEHTPGFVTVYCHCSKTLVKTGDYVKQGQDIALCGSTGCSTGPHLHFAVSVNGTYVDPNPYIGPVE